MELPDTIENFLTRGERSNTGVLVYRDLPADAFPHVCPVSWNGERKKGSATLTWKAENQEETTYNLGNSMRDSCAFYGLSQ